ncbi:MAG TPA: dihydrofolate reductase family protein [Iamia sp.]|nr:dihydrofolate reductase family protein [Iamia sp.]
MATFVYSVTMSLDGFIAGPDGDMSWMVPFLGPDPAMDAFVAEVGAVLVGGGTLRGRDPYEGTAGEGEVFGGGWEGPQIGVTSRPVAGVDCTADLDEAVARARGAAGDRVVNVLGATLARSLLERGVLDEVLTSVAPVLLGAGTRLFDHPGGTAVRLEPIAVAQVPLATFLRYRVVRG